MTIRIEWIEDYSALETLATDWRAVYAVDPDAQIFLSWEWMRAWLNSIRSDWIVLAARHELEGRHVAFFPLRLRTRAASDGGAFTTVAMAGNRFADYTGFIGEPRYDSVVIPRFAEAIRTLKWGLVSFEGLRTSDERRSRLVASFAVDGFETLSLSAVDPGSNVDNAICPCIDLPATWETYLDGLSANQRQKLRRLLRRVEKDSGLRLTAADTGTIDRDLDILIGLWRRRWAAAKGDRADRLSRNLRKVLEDAFSAGTVYLPLLRHHERPIGALAFLVDHVKKSMHFLVGARDPDFVAPQPGLALHALSIRYAIENGMVLYDFMRGDESYKFAFGARSVRLGNFAVRADREWAKAGVLDQRCLGAACDIADENTKAGRLDAAECGYRRALTQDHTDARACLGLGRVFALQGRLADALGLARRAVQLEPANAAAHYMLGVLIGVATPGDMAEALAWEGRIARAPDLELDSRLRALERSTGAGGRAISHHPNGMASP